MKHIFPDTLLCLLLSVVFSVPGRSQVITVNAEMENPHYNNQYFYWWEDIVVKTKNQWVQVQHTPYSQHYISYGFSVVVDHDPKDIESFSGSLIIPASGKWKRLAWDRGYCTYTIPKKFQNITHPDRHTCYPHSLIFYNGEDIPVEDTSPQIEFYHVMNPIQP